MAKDDVVGLVVGLAVLGGAAYAIHAGWLGKLFDGSIKLPELPGLPTGGGDGDGDGDGGSDVPTGSGITFAAAGDWGSGRNENWKKVVAAMKKTNPTVVLFPGDFSYSGGVAKWKPVTDAIKAFPTKTIGAEGNHDGGEYGSTFDVYSNSVTTVGNVSFMSLNSNSKSSAVSYLKSNASKMTARWKVVFFHHPVYTVKSDHGGDMASIQPELEAAKIDLCISAHNHNYQRFAPKGGVTHIVTGLGGEGSYPLGANCSSCPAFVKGYNSKPGFSVFVTTDTTISGKFINVDDAVIDTFTITKAASARAYIFSNT